MKRFIVRRKTVAKRLRNKLREVKQLLRAKWFRQLDLAPFDTFIWPHPLESSSKLIFLEC